MTDRLKTWFGAPLLSPKGFVMRAMLIALAFAVCHSLGLREYTSFLSGTSASSGTSLTTSAILGVIYMATYFGFVLATPILLIAAGIWGISLRYVTRG